MTNKEILSKIKENECYLIGQIPLSDEEIAFIMNYTKNFINLDDKYMVDGADLILSIGLVQVAINEYQDGRYWENLKNKFDIDISVQKQGILGRIFINTIKEFKLFELKQNENGFMQYVENIKAHAFVTNNYMEGFYDFLYDYYENNLFRDISNGVEETLQDLSDYIKTTTKRNNDTIYSNYNGKTKKSYKLLKSTREVIAQCSGDILYQLFYPSLKIIDNNFYDGILPTDTTNRFTKIFIEWNEKKNAKNENRNKIINKRKIYSHKPYLMLNTNKYVRSPFTLIIPKRRYRATECNGKVSTIVTINGIARPAKELEVSTNMGTYISEEYRYQVNYPFDEIKIEIVSLDNSDTVIPEKDYAIFNDNGIKVDRFEKGVNYLLTKPEANVKFSDESILIEQEECEEWIQYKLNIAEDSICYINNRPLTIIGEFSKEPIYEQKINFLNVYNEKEKKLIATKTHPLISFELDKNKLQGTTIQINEKNYPLANNSIAKYESPINKNQVIISIDLNDILALFNDYYKVELNVLGESNKLIAEYLLLNNVGCIFDKPRYIDEKEGKVTIKTNGLDMKVLDSECELIYSNESRNSYYYSFKLNPNYPNINIRLMIKRDTFYIKVPIKMMLYGFSSDNLQYGKLKELWYSQLQDLIYIQLPGAKTLGIYSNCDFNKVIWGEEVENNLFRINITSILQDIRNTSKQWIPLYIKYRDNKERWLPFYTIAKSVKIEPYFEFEMDNDIPCFKVQYNQIPGVRIFYSIEESNSHHKIINHRELKKGMNHLPEVRHEIFYNIIPTIEEIDEFGLNNQIITMPIRKNKGIMLNKFVITNILFKKDTLPLNNDYKYEIEIERRALNHISYGKLYEYEKTRRLVGEVRIYNIHVNTSHDLSFTMQNFSKIEDEWCELYYDKETKRMIENDNPILEEITSYKVIPLQPFNTKYIVKF